jgi:hypothetical protein
MAQKNFRCGVCELDLGSPRHLAQHFVAEPTHVTQKAIHNRYHRAKKLRAENVLLDRCVICGAEKFATRSWFCSNHRKEYKGLTPREAFKRLTVLVETKGDILPLRVGELPTVARTAKRNGSARTARLVRFCTNCGGPRHKGIKQRFCAYCGEKP